MSTSTATIRVENNPQKIRESGLLQQYGYEIVTKEGETYLSPTQTDGEKDNRTQLLTRMVDLGYNLTLSGEHVCCRYVMHCQGNRTAG
ncbi:hypothetical protein N7494_005194 [Penicillium frequentans]|uniref:Uncharacterized protein n=1 Tax=Penicillium frequentans TaxID=3151616 RepID=A0AAD6GFY2_9EURO|nr:hypothetical protein N7494_005194 [Penicillium glabrum]